MADIIKDPVTEKIIACCFEVHSELGPGFPEKVYHNALKWVLEEKRMQYESEKEFIVVFKTKKVGTFRCDLFIDGIIVELKSVTGIMPILFRNQLISYLKASKVKTGLLVNFGNKSCDIKRISV
jgi:GxxExxY protein